MNEMDVSLSAGVSGASEESVKFCSSGVSAGPLQRGQGGTETPPISRDESGNQGLDRRLHHHAGRDTETPSAA